MGGESIASLTSPAFLWGCFLLVAGAGCIVMARLLFEYALPAAFADGSGSTFAATYFSVPLLSSIGIVCLATGLFFVVGAWVGTRRNQMP
jgi:hypothetical protein